MILALLTLAATAPCQATLIAATPNENNVIFNGVSPDRRFLAIGWDRGSAPNVERSRSLTRWSLDCLQRRIEAARAA